MLAQRDAKLQFEASKELKRAFKGIQELHGHIHSLKTDLHQLADQLRSYIGTANSDEVKLQNKSSQQ